MLHLTSGLQRIVLVRATPFRIGAIYVDPPTRALSAGGRREVVEPRVMQTLVALAEANGAVVSRDDLIDRCWDGRIVSDNAINRAVARIRQVADDLAPGSLTIETITKVGYRLAASAQRLPAQSAPDEPGAASPLDGNRRTILAGAVALAAGCGGMAWWLLKRPRPEPEAAELFRRGAAAQRMGTPDQVVQATAFFERAVAIDPEYADAWGALALAYRHALAGYAEGDPRTLRAKLDAAAARALTLDPNNADARLARILARPAFRHWAEFESDLRSFVSDHSNHWLALGQLGLLLQSVGRSNEAIEFHRRSLAIEPFLPVGHAHLTRAYSLAGRLQEGDRAAAEALGRWPAHPMIWSIRYNTLIFNERPGEALAFAINPATRPQGVAAADIAERVAVARALTDGDVAECRAQAAKLYQKLSSEPDAVPAGAPMLAALGAIDDAFVAIERYLLGPPAVADPLRGERQCTMLFSGPIVRLHRDPRHAMLLRRVGLEDYYRASRSRPDFRRAG